MSNFEKFMLPATFSIILIFEAWAMTKGSDDTMHYNAEQLHAIGVIFKAFIYSRHASENHMKHGIALIEAAVEEIISLNEKWRDTSP